MELPSEIWFQILLFSDAYFVTTTAILINSSFSFLNQDLFWTVKLDSYSRSSILSLLLNQQVVHTLFSKMYICKLIELEWFYSISSTPPPEIKNYLYAKINVCGSKATNREAFVTTMRPSDFSSKDFISSRLTGSEFSTTVFIKESHCAQLSNVKVQLWHADVSGGRAPMREYNIALMAFRRLTVAIILFDSFDMDNFFSKQEHRSSKGSIAKAMNAYETALQNGAKYIFLVACSDNSAKFTIDLNEVKEFCTEHRLFFFEVNQTKSDSMNFFPVEYEAAFLEKLNLLAHSIAVMETMTNTKSSTIVQEKMALKKSWCAIG